MSHLSFAFAEFVDWEVWRVYLRFYFRKWQNDRKRFFESFGGRKCYFSTAHETKSMDAFVAEFRSFVLIVRTVSRVRYFLSWTLKYCATI
jgi:hypothetical protein